MRQRETAPVLMVPCPTCQARAGSTCVRPSQHHTDEPHKARKDAADYCVPCPHCGARVGAPCVGAIAYHAVRGDRAMSELRRRFRIDHGRA